jgi:phage tail sheath protein FI
VALRPGITIQHAREVSRDSGLVRGDVAAFLGVVPAGRWPYGSARGDFIELRLTSYADLLREPIRMLIDAETRRAIRLFFENGGELAFVLATNITDERDLQAENPFEDAFSALLYRLREDQEVALLAMPSLAWLPVRQERGGVVAYAGDVMIQRLLEHCAEMTHRFLIVDAPRGLHGEDLARWASQVRAAAGPKASFGALYYPWLRAGDELFPPSGAMAGIYARVEKERRPFGMGWPPANEVVRGVTHPEVELRFSETGRLAELGINPILTQPSRGVVVWGARTMSTDPRWLHINARRIVCAIAEQLRRDSEWVVFENQRPGLWAMVERIVRSRLDQAWGAGLLTGDRAGLEYDVKCDAELNPLEVRNAGLVNVKVVLRPISTTEHIVVEMRLGQGDVEMGGF